MLAARHDDDDDDIYIYILHQFSEMEYSFFLFF